MLGHAATIASAERLLKNGVRPPDTYLAQVEKHFDRAFIDCAPTDTVLTTSALMASHCVLVPIKPDRFSILGYEMVKQVVADFRRDYPDLQKVADLGVVFTLVSKNPDRIEQNCKDAVRRQAPYTFAAEIRDSKSYLRSIDEQKPIGLTSYARLFTRATMLALETELDERIREVRTPTPSTTRSRRNA